MISRLAAGSLVLLALAVPAGCGAAPASPAGPGCANPAAPHRAYVVVAHLGGPAVQRCVGFTGPQLTGDQLMLDSGIQTQAMQMSWGRVMCEVDGEPPPGTPCRANSQPHWVMYVWSRGWQRSQTALGQTILTDGQGLGWRYVEGDPYPPPAPARWSR